MTTAFDSLKVIVGRRGALFVSLGCFAAGAMAAAELAFAAVIQVLLHFLGVVNASATMPLGLPVPATLGETLGLMLLVGFVRGVCYSVVLATPAFVEQRALSRLRVVAFHRSMAGEALVEQGELNRALGEVATLAARFLAFATTCIQGLGLASVVLAGLLYISVPCGIAAFLGLGLIGGSYQIVLKRVRALAARSVEPSKEIFRTANRTTRLRKLISVQRLQALEFGVLAENVRRVALATRRAQALGTTVTTMVAVVGLGLVAALVKFDQIVGAGLGGASVAFFYLLMRLVQALSTISGVAANANVLRRPFAEAASWIRSGDEALAFDATVERQALPVDATRIRVAATQARIRAPSVEFQELSFGYGESKPVFRRFSCVVPAGSHAVVRGRSGLGKTTLLELAAGRLVGSSGRVLIDGRDAAEYCSVHAGQVAYVGVDGFLFPGTLRANLLYGAPEDVGEGGIWEALAAVGAADFVGRLAGGLDFVVKDSEEFSAGERQRLCLARALVKKPVLLLLDEITAHVDDATERQIFATLASLGRSCTILAIWHRTSTETGFDLGIELGAVESEGRVGA